MKKTFGKNLILFILIVMFTLSMAVGCTTLNVNSVADDDVTYNDESSITISSTYDVIAGTTGAPLELDVEVKMKNDDDHDRKWGSIDFYLNSDRPEIWTLSNNTNGLPYQFEEGSPFADEDRYTTEVTLTKDVDKHLGFLHFRMSAKKGREVAATKNVKFTLALKLNQDINTSGEGGITGTSTNFKVDEVPENLISSYIYTGTEQSGKFDASYSGDKDKGLNVGTGATVSITKKDGVADLFTMSLTDDTKESDKTTTYIKDTIDVISPAQGYFTYQSTTATKDKLTLFLSPANSGALITVQRGSLNADGSVVAGSVGKIYNEKAGDATIKLDLQAAYNIIYIDVKPADTTKQPRKYELRIYQSYIGLDNFEVSTDHSKDLDVKTVGLSSETPFAPNATSYKMFAPVGKNGGAKTVTIKPTIAEGYGAVKNYRVTGEGVNSLEQDSYTFNLPNAEALVGDEEYNLTFTFTGATGTEYTLNLKIITVSVDTTLSEVFLSHASKNDPLTLTSEGKYVGKLLKEGNYKALLAFSTTAGAKAEAKLYQNNEYVGPTGMTIGVDNEDIDKPFDPNEVFNYEIVVTAQAGNTTKYPLVLTKHIESGKIVSLEYSTARRSDGGGYDWDTEAIPVGKDQGFDLDNPDAKQEITINLPQFSITYIGFRVKVSDGASISVVDLTNTTKIASATNNKDTFDTYTYAGQYLKSGNNIVYMTTTSSVDNIFGHEYKINIVRTERDYSITSISMTYMDGNDEQNIIKNFSDLKSDLDSPSGVHANNIFDNIPYSVSEVYVKVYTNGESTTVELNGILLGKVVNADKSTIPGDTVHSYTLPLSAGRETIVTIVSKGTDGKQDPEKDKNYTLSLTRAAARSINTLNNLQAYLMKYDDNEELKYINNTGVIVDNQDDAMLITAFEENRFYYDCEIGQLVAYDVIEIIATTVDNSGATITGAVGRIPVNAPAGATKEFTVTVTPENAKGTFGQSIYHITVTSNQPQPDNNAEIIEIIMRSNNSINPLSDLNKGIPQSATSKVDPYKATALSYSNTSIYIDAKTAKGTAHVSILKIDPTAAIDYNNPNLELDDNGYITLEVGHNLFLITSYAADGTKGKDYFFDIERKAANSNVDLKGLTIYSALGTELLKTFNKNITDYEVSIPPASEAAEFIRFEASVMDKVDATIKLITEGKTIAEARNVLNYSTTKEMMLAVGESRMYTLVVVAEDGTEKTYHIRTSRQYDIGYLQTLNVTIDNDTAHDMPITTENEDFGAINPANLQAAIVDGGIREFFVKVPYSTTSVTLHATAPEGMRISFPGQIKLSATTLFEKGQTYEFTFTVSNGMSDDRAEVTNFKMFITREQARSSLALEEITSFTINEIPDFVYDRDKTNYKFVVNYDITKVTEVITFNNEKAVPPTYVVTVDGVEGKDLKCGLNEVKFTFTSADKSKKEYITIAIERKHASIAGVTASNNGTTIDTGVAIVDDKDTYNFNVKNEVETLDFNLNLAEGYTMGAVTGNTELKVGMNEIAVEVKDASGNVVRTLIFNVYREEGAPIVWFIVAGVLGGLVLVLLILTIIAFATRSGRKTSGNANDKGVGDFAIE